MMGEANATTAAQIPDNTSDHRRTMLEEQGSVISLIAKYALFVSLAYVAVYWFMGLDLLPTYNAFFSLIYALIAVTTNTENTRRHGIILIGSGLIQLAGTSAFFVPPEAGSHTYLLLIPIFSLVCIHPKDRAWWWLFSISTLLFFLWFEWVRNSWFPPFTIPMSPDEYRPWRVASACTTICLIVGVFHRFHVNLYAARKDLHGAYNRTESLLLSILPASIAARLKKKPGTIADDIDDASVLFADLVGFTRLAAHQTASETVSMLNTIFSEFDRAVDARGLEKIKTVGDAYMVASGVPIRQEEHTEQLLRLAREMLEIVARYNEEHDRTLSLRIGVSTGPLTAGVIGARKFIYDIWGDTVNVASRMESTGLPGRIQVTEAVVTAVGEDFGFEDRGLVPVKGKGEMHTFLLTKETD